nr:MAG TPA: hypothetical protein [Caudoviricetes sp.]
MSLYLFLSADWIFFFLFLTKYPLTTYRNGDD